MKKPFIFTSLFLLFAFNGYSQLLSNNDKLALEIPEQQTWSTTGISSYIKTKFNSDSDRVRAVFVWVANNINYDVDKVRLKKVQEPVTIEQVLKSRKAVCQGYSELMVQLCKEVNVNATLVSGYTKTQSGAIGELPHAWVAAEVNNKWFLFDPTWAAGSVKDWQFMRMFNNRFYKKLPEEMLADHMPFDPMYQFVNHPLMYDDFNKGNIVINTSKPFFNYTDTIKAYSRLDTLDQFVSVARRINKNGDKNQMVHDLLNVLNKNQNIGQSKIGFDGAVAEYRLSMDAFNKYIGHKNTRFSSIKDDKEIQQMIDVVLKHFDNAKQLVEPVVAVNDEQRKILANFNSSFYTFYKRVDEEKIFVKNYLKTDRATRR